MLECEPSYMSVIGWMLSFFFFLLYSLLNVVYSEKAVFSSKMTALKDNIKTDGVSAPLPSDAFKTLSI